MEKSGYGYACASGETFDSVALEVYGDEKYAAELMCANPELCEKAVFTGGETIILPVIESNESEEMGYTRASAPWKE